MLDFSISALDKAGHEVHIFDLYAMGFNTVASKADFESRRFPDQLLHDCELKHAIEQSTLPADVMEELEWLTWCDNLVLQFPLYWFSMPAIMKGWIERVFLNTVIYAAGKHFEAGHL